MTITKALVASLVILVACGGTQRNLELPVRPGQTRELAEETLRSSNYCRLESVEKLQQSYVRCGIKGFEPGESWVVLDYDKTGPIKRVRRMEHFDSHKQATKRWSELEAARSKVFGAEDTEARGILASAGEAPVGARVWRVWASADGTRVRGLYLVKTEDPKAPRVVEVIRWREASK